MNFEVCAMNIQSALAAEKAGAQRIELCTALQVGGLTPSAGLIEAAVKLLTIPVHVLIRPREGDFCYSATELAIMVRDISFCAEAGAAGVVVGALTPDFQLDLTALSAMKAAAGSMQVSSHRAADFTANAFDTLDTLIEMGFARVLSSGRAASAWEGHKLLKQMVEHAAGRIAIMPGAGINEDNIAAILRESGAADVHFTGKINVKGTSNADIPGLEADYWSGDVATIRRIIAAAQ